MFFVLILALFVSILFEGVLTTMPLAFILLLCYDVLNRSGKVFFSAFLTGLLIDLITVRPLGSTSIFFLLFFATILLYQKKYEIRSYPFVIVSSLVGSYLYLLLLSGNNSIGQALISSLLAVAIFSIGKKLRKKE
jgi:cell shape-determining protein MreD